MSYLNISDMSKHTDTLRAFYGIIESYLNKYVSTVIPVEVVQSNGQFVDVRNILHNVNSDSDVVQNEIIPNIPIMMLRGSGCEITFDVSVNDIGLLIACKNDITEFKTTKKTDIKIKSSRSFSFSDGFYLPLSFNNSPSGVMIRNGSNTFNIKSDCIEIQSTNIQIKGDLKIDGKIDCTGDIKTDSDCLAGNISLTNHVHDFVDHTVAGTINKTTNKPKSTGN